MENLENIVGIIAIGAIAGLSVWLLPDGSGKEVAIAACSGIGGYLTKGAVSKVARIYKGDNEG